MIRTDYQNWRLQTDQDKILWLTLDKKNASANTIDDSILTEFAQILTDLEQATDLKGVVIQSGKSSGFIAGANIEQFTKLETKEAREIKRLEEKENREFTEEETTDGEVDYEEGPPILEKDLPF